MIKSRHRIYGKKRSKKKIKTVKKCIPELSPAELTDEDKGDQDGLRELRDESQFEVSDGQEADGHDDQCHVVLPETPSGEIDTLFCQKCLPCAAASINTTQV